jgi:GT2 family glycosyltransferase
VRREVGAVGAKLYYPKGTIQHAGLIIGVEGIAIHLHKFFPRDSSGYFGRLKAIQNLSAVTGACLMTRREVFTEVGGFDERLSLAFNDVDLCLKIREKGYLIVWTPHAELYHNESKTRGYEDTHEKQLRFKKEIVLFLDKWGHILAKGDPYYNRNLNFKRGDFSIKI